MQKELLQHQSIGNEIYQEFAQTRPQEKESICSTITKRKLKTFKTQFKMMKKSRWSSNPVKEKKDHCYHGFLSVHEKDLSTILSTAFVILNSLLFPAPSSHQMENLPR